VLDASCPGNPRTGAIVPPAGTKTPGTTGAHARQLCPCVTAGTVGALTASSRETTTKILDELTEKISIVDATR